MPTVTKTKTHSKIRAWEQERRKRLGAAFSDLAAVLPTQDHSTSSSPPSEGVAPKSQILILQHSLRYIQQLQGANSNSTKGSVVDVAVETDETDEVSVLKAKCWELVKILLQARIPLPTPPLIIRPAEKYTNATDIKETDSTSAKDIRENRSDETVLNLSMNDETNSSSDQENSEEQEKKSDKKKQKKCDKCFTKSSKDKQNNCEDKYKENNVLRSNNDALKTASRNETVKEADNCNKKSKKRKLKSEDDSKKDESSKVDAPSDKVEGKEKRPVKKKCPINRKHTRKKETVGILGGLANVNNINNTSNVWITNAALRVPVVLPLLPHLLPPAPPTILINPFPFPLLTASRKLVHGFDITKTTMVNKVPIPTTTFSIPKKKSNVKTLKQLPKVSYQSKCKMLKALKSMKEGAKNDKDKKLDINNKENQSVGKEIVKEDDLNKKTDVVNKGGNISEGNQTKIPDEKEKQEIAIKLVDKVESVTELSVKEMKTKCDDIKQQAAVSNSTNVDLQVTKNINNETGGCLKNDVQKAIVIENTQNVVQSQNSCIQSTVQSETSRTQLTVQSLNGQIKSSDLSTNQTDKENPVNNVLETPSKVSQEINVSMCNKDSGIKKRKIEDNVEDSERQDIGGDVVEELSLPSPTAAFLHTFPLVCPGPSEPLQPPQDHFYNYFTRDTPTSTTTQSHNVFFSNDCHTSKSSIPTTTNIAKTTWSMNLNSTYSKPCISSDSRPLTLPDRNPMTVKDMSKSVTSSSACVFSGSQNIFSAATGCNNNYSFSDSIFNYEHTPVASNIKGIGKIGYTQNNKVPFNFDNIHSDNKQQTNNNSSSYVPVSQTQPSILYNNIGDKDSKTFPNNTKKNFDNSNISCKLYSETCPTNKGNILSTTIQSKPPFSNAHTVYTSTNSYNPFELPMTPTTFSTVSNTSARAKSSNMYFPEFSSNIYSQNCNLWTDENNGFGNDYTKTESNKKNSNSHNDNGSSITMDIQLDFRYPATLPKNSNINNVNNKNTIASQTSKNVKGSTSKISVKDSKYLVQDIKETKSEYPTQKGPINWMTSEVNFGQNNQDIFSSTSNQKDLRNNMFQTTNQCSGEASLPIAGVCNKRSELYDQPLYMPSSGFVPQNLNEDNQFTWSPSKLMPLADSTPLVPCSLPTLVGDLALSMGDAKQTYQHLFLEQADSSGLKNNDKKTVQQKEKTTVKSSNNKVHCDMTSNNSGSFLSVSQIMERGKDENVFQDVNPSNKTGMHYNQSRNVNINLGNINKPSDMPIFPADVFGVQQVAEYFPPSLHKVTQKNIYSTESLLQPSDSHYVSSSNKSKHVNKSYDASNLCISSNANTNQHSENNNQMEFDNFSHSNFGSNSYCYPSTVNTPLYTTSNYIGPTASSYSCINSGYMGNDGNDYTSNVDNNFYSKMDACPPLDVSKYNLDNNKNPSVVTKQHKKDVMKKDVAMKRQRKSALTIGDNYMGGTQRCYPSTNPLPLGGDDGLYGYQMTPGNYSSTAAAHKVSTAHAKPPVASPNHSGTSSLANFNLSTIFPEINKRPTMPGYPDSSYKPSMSLYL